MFKFTTLDPWYVNLNPNAYVPTMLVNPNNTPVVESKVIINYMEEKFEGTKSIGPGADPVILERFEQFINWHDNWDVEIFSLGWVHLNHFVADKLMRTVQANSFFKA